MTEELTERLGRIRLYAQDCMDTQHVDGGSMGNLMCIRDEVDALLAAAKANPPVRMPVDAAPPVTTLLQERAVEHTLNNQPIHGRDIYYFRQRYKNRTFTALLEFFEQEAKRTGITKKNIADRLKKDPALINRWFKNPSNMTQETISDILLALDAEPEPPKIVAFRMKSKAPIGCDTLRRPIDGAAPRAFPG